MFYILALSLAGIFLGLVFGLLPGIHPNQVYALLVASLPLLSVFPAEGLLSLILCTAVTNIMSNYIPAIFFSVPDPNTVINVLPGHRMVIEGKGLSALFVSLAGAFFTLLSCIILLPFLLYLIPLIHELVYPYLHVLLSALVVWMIMMEKTWRKRLLSLFLFLASGVWGLVCLNSKLISADWALFPALTGMFGVAGLLMSIQEVVKLPKQEETEELSVGSMRKVIISGLVAGLLIGILPGAGESQAGVLVSQFTKLSQTEFLASLAGINTSNMFFALVSLYSFGKIRSGAASAIERVIPYFTLNHLVFSVGAILFSAGLSVVITWYIGKRLLGVLEKVDYKRVSIMILAFTVGTVFWLTGPVGVFIMCVSTCLGLLPILWGVKRTSNMGFLMLSTILYFSGLTHVVSNILL